MYILGISCYYHDASAALIKDGIVVAAAEEERFTRKKHDTSFPINSIRYCLTSQNITSSEIDYVGFYEKPLLKFERVLSQHLDSFPFSLKTFVSSMPSWMNEKLRLLKKLKKEIKYNNDVFFIEHHLAHASSTFHLSPFLKSAIMTIDGVGEWSTTTYGIGNDNDIHLIKKIDFPHSIGLLYSTITAYLGFSVNNSEYKVMGLSPYGDMNKNTNPYYSKLIRAIDIKEDGSFRMDMRYFKYHYADRMPSRNLCKLLGGPVRKSGGEITQRHKDIAAALQLITEEVLTKILHHVYDQTQCENIVLAGGVALNSVYNGKILSSTPFKNIWIQPNASDGGTSIGAASYVYYSILGNTRKNQVESVYLGPDFSTDEIRYFLDTHNIKYTYFNDAQDFIYTIAELIHKNHVIGWFQGRMEWGPRALGNRSILANPCNPEAKELLNSKVKHRENFRPFAPVICEEDVHTYFDCDIPLPEPCDYMLMVYPIKKEWHKKLPSVTHVDGSGRLQVIKEHQNPLYYNLIKTFEKLSGIPILINTSFNIRGEPIVCTPSDAYKCMMGTEIDFLAMDNFLIQRNDNPNDIWDSEKHAID